MAAACPRRALGASPRARIISMRRTTSLAWENDLSCSSASSPSFVFTESKRIRLCLTSALWLSSWSCFEDAVPVCEGTPPTEMSLDRLTSLKVSRKLLRSHLAVLLYLRSGPWICVEGARRSAENYTYPSLQPVKLTRQRKTHLPLDFVAVICQDENDRGKALAHHC